MSSYIVEAKILSENGIMDWMRISNGYFHSLGIGKPPEDPKYKFNYVIPGFIDSHIHLYFLGISLNGSYQLPSSLQEIKESIKLSSECQEWVIGMGWSEERLGRPCGSPLTRHDIDNIDTPCILFRTCMHLCVLNTAALKRLGFIGEETPAHPDSLMDPITKLKMDLNSNKCDKKMMMEANENGKEVSLGVFSECVFDFLHFMYLKTSFKDIKNNVLRGMNECLSNGITTVQTNDFFNAWQMYKRISREWEKEYNHTQPGLPIRIMLTVPFKEIFENLNSEESSLSPDFEPLPNDESGLLSCHRVKLFADGSLGAQTAALTECYHGTCHKGSLSKSKDDLMKDIKIAHSLGYRLEIHVIGDAAAEVVLEILEESGIDGDSRPILTQ